MVFRNICDVPDVIQIQTEDGWIKPNKNEGNLWIFNDIVIDTKITCTELQFYLNSQNTPIKRIIARWKYTVAPGNLILGDHWERGYGDLEWRGIVPERVLPWYFHISDKKTTHGYGVKTGSNSMCFWQVNENDITLCMDVRCGGSGVILSGKKLHVSTVVCRQGIEGESPFTASKSLCRLMCDNPLIPSFPIYGGNNWYYAYGQSDQKQIIEDSKRISNWATSKDNRPFSVIDACWQENIYQGNVACGGPWYRGNKGFPDMESLATRMKDIGVRPGLWCRPLLTAENVPDSWLLKSDRFNIPNEGKILDPSIPEVLEHIGKDFARFSGWGYQLIKHDFSTYDIFGRWGYIMSGQITDDGWSFADRSKTSAEIIKEFYKIISINCKSAIIIGCNTISHLSAGLFHVQRTGDDTSGVQWERTRKMGINTLAFRMPQHNTFYATDADCVGITNHIPWKLNEQWLRLLSQSGTPLFVSASPDALGYEQEKAIKEAFTIASKSIATGEPMDWLETTCPAKWLLNGNIVDFEWQDIDRHLEI
ncbi:MAG: alpha-galactosidase [Eubacteriales bacterium]